MFAIASVAMRLPLDSYIVDTLMPDLMGHDRAPSAFVVYLFLWRRTRGQARPLAALSLQTIAVETGLAKSSVQNALRRLKRRRLVSVRRDGPTAPCRYEVHEPWKR